jgi:membrane protease YdiL (CAAX protease family)
VPPEPRLPTPREAAFAWLIGLVVVIAAGLSMAAVAAGTALAEGLSADAALALISDPLRSPLVTSPSWIAASIAVNELCVGLLLVFWWRRLRAPIGQILPLSRPSLRALVGAVLLPFGFAPLAEVTAELVYRWTPNGLGPDHFVATLARGTTPQLFAIVLLCAAVMPALAEEALFRGFVMTAFRRYAPLVVILVSSAMFGLFHLDPTQAAGTAVLGTAFGLVRLYTGSIWACMLSHCAYNAGVILEARWLADSTSLQISWGRVGIGLVLAFLALALLVGDLGRRHLLRLSFRPPPSSRGPS